MEWIRKKIRKIKPGSPEDGTEKVVPGKIAIPAGYSQPESVQQMIQRLVRGELSRRAQDAGHESFEDSDDFNVGDDYDPKSPYEENFEGDANLADDFDRHHKLGKYKPKEADKAKADPKSKKGKTPPKSDDTAEDQD